MIAIDDLLDPVPGEAPHGVDLRIPRYHRSLSDLKAAWQRVRQRDQKGDGETGSDWREVEKQARIILSNHSKDLEVAAWLSEAMTRTAGIAGLAAAGEFIAGLIERFWSALYPTPNPDEPIGPAPETRKKKSEDARLDPLNRLGGNDGRLLPPVRAFILFTLGDGTAFAVADCRSSRSWSARSPEERTEYLKGLSAASRARREGTPGQRLWDTVKEEVLTDHASTMTALRRDVEAALVAWRTVETALKTTVGEGRFSARPLTTLLEEISLIVTELAPPPARGVPDETASSHEIPVAKAVATEMDTRMAIGSKQIDNREAALSQLAEIAAFFRRTEPHTSVAYMVEQVVRRARLSWPEWIAEAVPDTNQRETILARLGLPTSPPAE